MRRYYFGYNSTEYGSRQRPAGKGSPASGKRGVALLLALVFIVLLSVLVIEFSYEARVDATLTMNHTMELEALVAARSAVANGLALLAEAQLPDEEYPGAYFDSVLDMTPWYGPQPFEPINDALMRTTIMDEYGKINLNALMDNTQYPPVERELLVQALRDFFYFRNPDIEDPVDAILDWLDYGAEEHVRPEGAETEFYQQAKIPYMAKNGPMDSIEELLLIRGITPEIYFGNPEEDQLPLPEHLTVHGDWAGRVNVNTAEPETLAAVIGVITGNPMDLDMAEEIYTITRTEAPFTDVGQLNALLGLGEQPRQIDGRQQQPLQGQQQQQQQQEELEGPVFSAEQFLTVGSNVFRIYGDGMADDIMVRVEAYVWRTPWDLMDLERSAGGMDLLIPEEAFRILDWSVIR